MKEKILLTFALLLTAVTGAWAEDSESCGTDVSYSYVESTHTLTISGTGAMTDYNYPSEQPWYSYATEIETVIIKDGVTGIGNCAFLNCTGLTTVTIGTGVTYIGIDAFNNCTNVTDVYCNADPEKLTWDESNCDDFKPDGTTIIHVADAAPWYTKFGCEVNGTFIDKPYVPLSWNYDAATKTLTFSGTVIPSYDDLDECPWKDYVEVVKNIVIENGVTHIGNHAFEGCESLTTVTFATGSQLTSIGIYAFNNTGLTSIEIPASVMSIGMFAFYDCYSLTTVTIGSGVTYIGYDAFYNCTNVEVVYCNADPEKLEWEEDGCNDFKQDGSTIINVADAAPWIAKFTDVVNGTFSDTPYVPLSWNYDADTKTLTFRGTVIPSYEGLEERPWEDYVEVVENIVIEDDVTSIGDHAFEGCVSLTTVTFATGSQLTSIGIYAFNNTGLTSIEIPASVMSIGEFAFIGCNNLATVTVYAPSCSLGVDAFDNCGNLANIYVFSDRVEYYKGADKWNAYEGIITEMPNPNGKCGENVRWVLTGESSNYTLTITGTGAMADYASSSDQPWKDYHSSIKTVVIGAGVTSIGNYTFAYCTGLTSIEIPASVTSIGWSAFWNCSYLATVTFAEDSQLTSIGVSAFEGCSGLTSIEIPAGVTSIGNDAFRYCSGLATVTFAAGSQLTSIGNNAFNNTGLTSIEIPASVTSISNGAFINCSNLEAMTVDGENAVYDSRDNCNAIIEKSSNTLIVGCKNTTIPDDVTIIRDYAFNGCTGLTSIEIPASVTSIGNYTFAYCTGLTSIEIPASVTSIGVSAFEGCSGLTSIEIPAGVTSIGGYAFNGCTGLTSIEIPASVTTIGNSALRNCSNLATVTVYAPSCTLGSNAFANCNNLTNIYVFSDLVDYYQKKENWKSHKSKITEMPNPNGKCGENVRWVLTGESSNYTLTITGTGAMADYVSSNQPWKDYRSSIKTFVIGNGVTTIGNLAFGRCTGLTSINIPSSVTSIGSYAFYNTNLTSIEIPASVTSIGGSAFSGCTGLTSVTFATGSQLTSIGDATFQSCSSLTSIEIPASVENIGDHAFDNCSSLTSIEIPASVENIGDRAFDNCSNLATITVYAPDCTLGGSAFSGCNKLTNIYVLSNKVVSYKSAWSAYADKIAVMFDGTSTTTVNFDNDVTVNGVLYNRTFTASKPSTVMLPFSLSSGQTLTGGTLYKFSGVTKNETTGKWEATMTETTTLQANTPYLLLPDENLTDGKVTFDLNNSTVILNTTDGGGKETADQGSHWTFKGTYEYMKWTTDTSDPDYNAERKAEIGRAYGFAGVAKTGIEVGDFVKVASGAKIRPMGCYLLWSDTPNPSRAAARSAATEELPQSITVRLVSADGEVTGIGEIDTKTGEMTFDSEAWYTLNGVRLSGKPTKKGLYINNGKKVVIK